MTKIDIGADPFRMRRLRDDRDALLKMPLQHDLRRRTAVFRCQLLNVWIREVSASKRRPGLYLDASFSAKAAKPRLDIVQVDFDLVDGRLCRSIRKPVQMMRHRVAQTDLPRLAFRLQCTHLRPARAQPFRRLSRPVDQQQIHMIALQPVQAVQQTFTQSVRGHVPRIDLGGQKHLIPWDPAMAQRIPQQRLIAIHLRGVEQAVAGTSQTPQAAYPFRDKDVSYRSSYPPFMKKGRYGTPYLPVSCVDYSMISVTFPAPTVRPPSRIENFVPFSMAIGAISSTVISTLSPGITMSVPSGSVMTPVTSVVRK